MAERIPTQKRLMASTSRPGRIIGGAPAGAARAIHSVDGSHKSVGLAPQKFQRHQNKASLAVRRQIERQQALLRRVAQEHLMCTLLFDLGSVLGVFGGLPSITCLDTIPILAQQISAARQSDAVLPVFSFGGGCKSKKKVMSTAALVTVEPRCHVGK